MDDEQGAAAVAAPDAPQVNKKQEEKFRKRDSRSWENVEKDIAMMEEEDKLNHVTRKYQDLYNELRTLTQTNYQLTKQNATFQKEVEIQRADLGRSVMARSRLENLCRELQRQNKQIKEENMAKIKEEEERRKEVSLKFSDKLTDINNMMDENREKSEKLREENIKMTAKLADLYQQFQQREQDIAKVSQQLELERKYSQATLSKMELEIQAEKQMHAREIEILKNNLEKSEENCTILMDTVKGLQDHIDVYKNQYDDFESTMYKSTKVFDNFKQEIANMTKQVTTLEQESISWKNKFHDSMKALVEMSEWKRSQEVYLQTIDKKNDQLHKLCRQLQVERSNYLKVLKQHGIEPPAVTPVKEKSGGEAAPKKNPSPKITKKEKELKALKENLKAVQDRLNRINVEESEKSQTKKTDAHASQVVEDDGAKNKDVQPESTEVLAETTTEPTPSLAIEGSDTNLPEQPPSDTKEN